MAKPIRPIHNRINMSVADYENDYRVRIANERTNARRVIDTDPIDEGYSSPDPSTRPSEDQLIGLPVDPTEIISVDMPDPLTDPFAGARLPKPVKPIKRHGQNPGGTGFIPPQNPPPLKR